MFLEFSEVGLLRPVDQVIDIEHLRSVASVKAPTGLTKLQPLAALRQNLHRQKQQLQILQTQLGSHVPPQRRCATQTGPSFSVGHSSSLRSLILACSHTALASSRSLPFQWSPPP